MIAARWRQWVAAAVVIFGVGCATQTLLINRADAQTPFGCPGSAVTPVINCAAVITTASSRILGWPLGLWGLAWFLGWAGLALWPGQVNRLTRVLYGLWVTSGIAGVGWALDHEWLVRHVCVWCTAAQASMIFLMVWGCFLRRPPVPSTALKRRLAK